MRGYRMSAAEERTSKRTKIEELLKEELNREINRPSSHSSHFDDQKPVKKPQDKRITELLAENLQEQLILKGHSVTVPNNSTGTVGAATGRPTASSTSAKEEGPMEGDLAQLSLHSSFFVGGVRIGWPFPVVMRPQRNMAIHLITALKASKHVVLESPTGTGKSAAILCAVLAWQRYHAKLAGTTDEKPVKIIYCSRTHSQVAQMISSLRKTPYRPRMAVLGSRNHLCINKHALDSGNVNTECRVRVGNTDGLRKRMYMSTREHYNDDDPPIHLPQDDIESATTTTTATPSQDDNDNDDEGLRGSSTKACCPHYRQLGPKRTADLACNTFVPCCSSKKGGELSKHGTHDVEDLVQFGKDPHKRTVAVYRSSPQEPFGMTLVQTQGRIEIAIMRRPSPASATSLKQGDEILTVNGWTVEPTVDLVARRIGQTQPNKPLMLEVTSSSVNVVRDTDKEESPHAPCPYYLARALATHAQLVFCPYNYVLDPFIRKSLDIGLENSVVVLDEAHNVEDTLRESGSGKFGEFELAEMVVMLQFYASAAKTGETDPEKKDISECAHELLLFIETLMHFLITNKIGFERAKSPKLLEDWRKFHTPDDTEFDMTFDGPNGHGVMGKAVGCATFFDKLGGTKFDGDALRKNLEAIDAHVRPKQNFESDMYSGSIDKMNELMTILSYAREHHEHYYIASVAKANGSLEFASGQMATVDRSTSRFQKKPQRLPLIPPRKGGDSMNAKPQVCLHACCRSTKSGPNFIDGQIRHGDYCNGSQPPWEAWLVIELLTPSSFFKDLRTQCRTIVLASGSLAPIPSLCAELGLAGEVKDNKVVNVKKAATKPGEEEEKKEVPRLQIKPAPLEADHVIDLEKQLLAVSCGYFPDGTCFHIP